MINETALMLAGVGAVHALAMLSPGPNVLVVTQTALADSRRAGVWTALGVATGTVLWASAALFGLGLLFAQWAWLTVAVELAGGVYLVYLGVRVWRGADRDPFSAAAAAAASLATAAAPVRIDRPKQSDVRAFRVGLLTNLTNPKALMFFGSIFAALLPTALPLPIKLAAIVIVAVNSLVWHVALACFFSARSTQSVYVRIKPWLDRAAAVLLVCLGLRLLFARFF